MLGVIVLLLQNRRFDFEYKNIVVHIRQDYNGISAKVSLFGTAAWGYTKREGTFEGTVLEEVQKILYCNIPNKKQLLKYYKDYEVRRW